MTGSIPMVDLVAMALLDVCGVSHVPPIDLTKIARHLGVMEIRVGSAVEDGRLEHSPGGSRILLSDATGPARQRFTLGHELGHILLTDPEEELISFRRRPERADSVEQFCDSFSAALLMPRDWLVSEELACPEQMATIARISAKASVSMSAAFLRARDVLGWDVTLLGLARGPRKDDWRVRSMYRRTKGLYHLPVLRKAAEHTLDSLVRTSPDIPCLAQLEVQIAGKPRLLAADVLVNTSGGFALGKLVPKDGTAGDRQSARRRSDRLGPLRDVQLRLF